jgi:hypothetical protein
MQRFVDVDTRLMASTCQFTGYVHFSFLSTLDLESSEVHERIRVANSGVGNFITQG